MIAEDITGEALSTLVINKLRGVAQVCAVKAPGYGDRRKAMLGDLAMLDLAARLIMKDLGSWTSTNVTLIAPRTGQEGSSLMATDQTTIIEGIGDKADIQGRVDQIRREIEASEQRL